MAPDPEFDRFFVNHFDDLVRSLTAVTGDEETARDCVQEAFVRAFARWRHVRRYDNPVTWVRRVAINLSHDAHRSDRRRRRREDRIHDQRDQVAEAAGDVVAAELRPLELLRHLTPQQRCVAALYYVEDISVAEIAASLELSTGAVKFHLSKARASLKALLEREEVHSD